MKFSKRVITIFIALVPISLFGLELHNLDLILEIVEPDTTAGTYFGVALNSGDVNGDGFSDIIVGGGAINYKKCVCIYYGGSTIDSIYDLIIMERQEDNGYHFGFPIEIGDINGDGYDDVIIMGGKYTRVYFGGNPMDTVPDLIMKVGDGYINGKCGDFNDDGYDDWVIPEYAWDGGRGKVDIYFGDSIPNTISDITLRGEGLGNLGGGISSGFDVNNDGYHDLFISATWYSGIYGHQGKTYIYYGGNPMDTIPDVEMLGKSSGDEFGKRIALLPDLNEDGFDDACVGDNDYVVHDAAYIYWGGNLMNNSEDLFLSGDSGTSYGYAVSGIKNISLNGKNGLIVGACGYPGGYNCKGKIYVYIGGDSIDTTVDAYAVGEDSLQQIGWSVADAGDINGDGCNEIMFSNYASSSIRKVWVCKYTGPGIEEKLNIKNQKSKLEVSQNPFIKSTTLKYELPVKASVSLNIYNASGTLIKTLVNEQKQPGAYTIDFNAKGLPTGIYFAKFKAGSYQTTKKLIFIK